MDLVVAATETAVMMVESEAAELPEDVMLGAVWWGRAQQQPVIDMIHCARRSRRQTGLGLAAAGQRPGWSPRSLKSPARLR